MNFLAGITASAPYAFLALPLLLGALLYVYRRGGNAVHIVVPTLLFLRTFQNVPNARTKVFPPLRFWIELLILLFLLSGIAGLSFSKSGTRYAIVIDNSLSMALTRRSSGTLLDEARQSADGFLSSLPPQSRTSVFVTSPKLREIPEGEDFADIELSKGNDQLDDALSYLRESGRFDTIEVFTDKEGTSAADVRVHTVEKPKGQTNVAFQDVGFQKKDHTAFARVVFYGVGETPVRVNALSLEETSSGIVSHEIGSQRINLKSGRIEEVSFPIPRSLSLIQFTISREGGVDGINEDNEAWISLQSANSQILFVGDVSAEKLGLTKDIGDFRSISPESYLKEPIAQYQGILFHRFVPPKFPSLSAVYVDPPEGKAPYLVESIAGGVDIARWSVGHPINRYLNLSELSLPQARRLTPPGWAEGIITSEKGIVAFAGSFQNARYAAVGFELLPFEGKGAPFTSIAALNLLSWTFQTSYRGYSSLFDRVGVNGSLREAHYQDETSVPVIDGKIVPERPGLIQVQTSSETRFLAVNFFSSEESDVTASNTLAVPLIKQGEKLNSLESNRSERFWFLSFASLLLAGEMASLLLKGDRIQKKKRAA